MTVQRITTKYFQKNIQRTIQNIEQKYSMTIQSITTKYIHKNIQRTIQDISTKIIKSKYKIFQQKHPSGIFQQKYSPDNTTYFNKNIK